MKILILVQEGPWLLIWCVASGRREPSRVLSSSECALDGDYSLTCFWSFALKVPFLSVQMISYGKAIQGWNRNSENMQVKNLYTATSPCDSRVNAEYLHDWWLKMAQVILHSAASSSLSPTLTMFGNYKKYTAQLILQIHVLESLLSTTAFRENSKQYNHLPLSN